MVLACRISVGVMFLLAGLSKVADLEGFARAVARYGIVPRSLLSFVALTLPPVEVALGLFLLVGFLTRWTALGAVVLLLAFSLATGIVLLRGASFDCGCLGIIAEERIGLFTLTRNALLTAGALLVFGQGHHLASIDKVIHRGDR
ncbi:MAG: MauE/DoxX family redox-associated membrane protein [Candidatus Oleimicrobiaceae bacterium]